MSAKEEFTRNIVKILVLCVILYGSLFYLAPFVAEIASKFTGGKTQVVVTAIVNSPTLSNLPQLVNKDTVTLEGISSANTQVELFLNDSSYGKTSADNDGKFKFENVSIIKGVNKIQLKAKNSDGIESPKSKEYSLNFDDKKPEIKNINISNNQVITNLNKNVDMSELNYEKLLNLYNKLTTHNLFLNKKEIDGLLISKKREYKLNKIL